MMAFDSMSLKPVPNDLGALEAAQRGPLLDIAKSFGTSLGFLPFHGIIQNASRRLIVGTATEASNSRLGLDLFRSTGKNAL